MATPIDRATLAAVCGAGESRTRVDVGPLHVEHTTSDYQACVAAMRNAAARQYPYNGLPPFMPDFNAIPRARAEAENIGRYCGRPQQPAPHPPLRGSVR